MSDYYELLQVRRDASADEIKRAYRRLARQYHPDSNRSHLAAEHMKLLNAAYSVLSDPTRRQNYDERLALGMAPPAEETAHAASAVEPVPAWRPWLLWIGITALLIVLAFIGTLLALREQFPMLGALPTPTPTRLAAAPATAQPTWTRTATPAPTGTPTGTPTQPPTATRTQTPTPTPTASPTLSPTPTPTAVRSATPGVVVPFPTSLPPGVRLVTSEVTGNTGTRDLFVVGTNGAGKINITRTDDQIETSPSWSPDGQRIVYSEFNSGALYLMDPDGTHRTRLTDDPQVRDSAPLWSPTGNLIAYHAIPREAFNSGNRQAARVFVMDPNTGQKRQISDRAAAGLAWSPDGSLLAYFTADGPNAILYVSGVGRPGSPYYFFTPYIRRAAWTPDSRRVVAEAALRDTNGNGRLDDADRPELWVTNFQPIALTRLAGTLEVVSRSGKFPGTALDGDYYPPLLQPVSQ